MNKFIIATALTVLTATTVLARSPYLDYDASTSSRSYNDNFPNWYLGVMGTVSFVDDAKIGTEDENFNVGGGGNIAIGYRPDFNSNILDGARFELSLGYYVNEARDIDSLLSTVNPFLNFYYDFNSKGSFKPYIGAGVGAAIGTFQNKQRNQIGFLTDADGDGITDQTRDITDEEGNFIRTEPVYILDDTGNQIPVYTEVGDDSDLSFAYQFMAGFAYEFESLQKTEFVVGYRYMDTLDMSYNVNGQDIEADYQSHNIDVGFRFRF